jgi:hypothetical protein
VIIIGLGHKARSGKDTAGEAIVQHYADQFVTARKHGQTYKGPRIVLMKFAGALYKEARELHGMTEKDPVLLQNIGMARRAEDPDYWVKRAFAAIPQGTDIAVFTDVRFLNEAAAIKAKHGYLINVVRLNEDGSRYFATDRPANHPSETELDAYNWDFQIVSKSAALTGEVAITIAEYIRGLETK